MITDGGESTLPAIHDTGSGNQSNVVGQGHLDRGSGAYNPNKVSLSVEMSNGVPDASEYSTEDFEKMSHGQETLGKRAPMVSGTKTTYILSVVTESGARTKQRWEISASPRRTCGTYGGR